MPHGNYAPVEETAAKRCCLIIDFFESIFIAVLPALKLYISHRITSPRYRQVKTRINSGKMQLGIYFIRRYIRKLKEIETILNFEFKIT